MANSKTSKVNYRQATVDTNPGSSGYWTDPISPRSKSLDKMYMSICETGDSASFTATVTLQFKPPAIDDWQVYDTYTAETREIIEDSANCQWRVGVDNGDYTDGTVSVQIDW